MSCAAWIDAISARADGEDAGVDERLLDAHLRRCAACRAFAATVDGHRRHAVVAAATPLPDLSRRVSRANAIADRASRWGLVRALLAIVAVEVIVFAAPALVLGEGESDVHGARHLGAFSVAYGVALLVVVVRPARARAVLPVAAFLAVALLVTAVVDLLDGVTPLDGEITHVPEVVSVLLVWLIAVPSPRRSDAAARHEPRSPLRLVTDEQRATGS